MAELRTKERAKAARLVFDMDGGRRPAAKSSRLTAVLGAVLASAAISGGASAWAQSSETGADGQPVSPVPPGVVLPPGCALTGSPNVMIGGRPALRLSDVAACPGLAYEIVPSVFVNGEPAVKLLPNEDCAAQGASDVLVEGGPAARSGDVNCVRP